MKPHLSITGTVRRVGIGANSPERSRRVTRSLALSLMLLLMMASLFTACTTTAPLSEDPLPEPPSAPPKPGAGLKEYQQLMLGLREATLTSRQAVGALAMTSTEHFPEAYKKFLSSIERLEVTSIEARSRVEAMEKRGEAYFEEWADELSTLPDEKARGVGEEQLGQLRQHYIFILGDSRQVREEFRKFLDGLRSVRAGMAKNPSRAMVEQVQPPARQVVSDGIRAGQAMDRLITRLRTAQTAVEYIGGPAPMAEGESLGKPAAFIEAPTSKLALRTALQNSADQAKWTAEMAADIGRRAHSGHYQLEQVAAEFKNLQVQFQNLRTSFQLAAQLTEQLKSSGATNAVLELETGLDIISEGFAPLEQELQAGYFHRDTVASMGVILSEALQMWERELKKKSSRLGKMY